MSLMLTNVAITSHISWMFIFCVIPSVNVWINSVSEEEDHTMYVRRVGVTQEYLMYKHY